MIRSRHAVFLSLAIKCTCAVLLLWVLRFNIVSGALSDLERLLFDTTLSIDRVREALEKGARVDAINDEEMTPLMIAAEKGDFDRVKLLVEYGADINAQSVFRGGRSVLHMACGNGVSDHQSELIRYLIQQGADVQSRMHGGDTVLHALIQIADVTNNYGRRSTIFTMLIEHGADPNAQNNRGNTLAHLSVQIRDQGWIMIMRDQWGSLIRLDMTNNDGARPIDIAQDYGFTDIVKELEKPAYIWGIVGDVNLYNHMGLTGLHVAAVAGNQELVATLMRVRNADGNLKTKDAYGYTALQLAMMHTNSDMVKQLTDLGCRADVADNEGETALHSLVWMVRKGVEKKKIVDLFIKNGYDPNIKSSVTGNTMVHQAVLYNDSALLTYLATRYNTLINWDAKNIRYETPASLASSLRKSDIEAFFKNRKK